MFTNILSATMNYADYALIGLGVIVFLYFFSRGLSKSLYGFFFVLVIIIGGLYLSGLTTEPILKSPVGQQFNTTIESWSTTWGDAFNCEISFVDNCPVIYPAGSTEAVALSSAVGDNKILVLFIEKIVPKIIPAEGGMSLADIIVPNMTYILGYIIVLILMCILLKIAFGIINKLWDKYTHNGTIHKGSDKFFGGVISLLYSATFTMFILAIIGVLADKSYLATTVQTIKDSTYCSWIFVNNPVLTIFLHMFVA